MKVCTIVARNYLAHARVLCRSVQRTQVDASCYALVIDADESFDAEGEPFELLRLNDILSPSLIADFTFKYDVTELATAVKPFLLLFLLEQRKFQHIIYLDPDIFVTGSLDLVVESLTRSAAVLTPHLDSPYPDDGLLPNDSSMLIAGMFNLGFLAVTCSAEATRFLQWLAARLIDNCVVEPKRGFFVDQRFVDIAYIVFPIFEILRQPGLNVAYWNLHSRKLSRSNDDRWLCNGELLRFFHFSDYKPETPDVISRHMTRYNMSNRPDIEALFELYRTELLSSGYADCLRVKYRFGRFTNGTVISSRFRRVYRRWLRHLLPHPIDPFASTWFILSSKLIDLAGETKRSFVRIIDAIRRRIESKRREV